MQIMREKEQPLPENKDSLISAFAGYGIAVAVVRTFSGFWGKAEISETLYPQYTDLS